MSSSKPQLCTDSDLMYTKGVTFIVYTPLHIDVDDGSGGRMTMVMFSFTWLYPSQISINFEELKLFPLFA